MRGQIVTMVDRAYLTQAMPMLVVWGSDDVVIPVKHAENVARIAPGAVVEVIPNSGHFPHKDHPERFVKIVNTFVRATQPASYHRGRWRTLLRNGPTEPVNRPRPANARSRRSPACADAAPRSVAAVYPGARVNRHAGRHRQCPPALRRCPLSLTVSRPSRASRWGSATGVRRVLTARR